MAKKHKRQSIRHIPITKAKRKFVNKYNDPDVVGIFMKTTHTRENRIREILGGQYQFKQDVINAGTDLLLDIIESGYTEDDVRSEFL